jgi:hypothetical protein
MIALGKRIVRLLCTIALATASAGVVYNINTTGYISPIAWADDGETEDDTPIHETTIYNLHRGIVFDDNRRVSFTGEVAGDNITANTSGSYRWIMLLGTEENTRANITLYISEADAAQIDTYGAYNITGTILQVVGTYHLACSEHDGQSDVHAETVEVVQKGKHSQDEFNLLLFIVGSSAVIGGLLIMAAFYYIRRKQH